MPLGAGRLDHARPAARQVADGPVAHPAGSGLHVGRLGGAQLAARALDVAAERLPRAPPLGGIGGPPTLPPREGPAVPLPPVEVPSPLPGHWAATPEGQPCPQ